MTSLEKLGQKITKLRQLNDMSQEDLAGAAQIDRSYLSELENGLKNPSFRILEKIAAAFNLSVAELVKLN